MVTPDEVKEAFFTVSSMQFNRHLTGKGERWLPCLFLSHDQETGFARWSLIRVLLVANFYIIFSSASFFLQLVQLGYYFATSQASSFSGNTKIKVIRWTNSDCLAEIDTRYETMLDYQIEISSLSGHRKSQFIVRWTRWIFERLQNGKIRSRLAETTWRLVRIKKCDGDPFR